jgi:hypothetical protein
MCLLQHLYERRLKNQSILALQGSVGRRLCPPDLLCQHRQGRFLLCLLVTTKAFRRKCHASFIYTEAGYGGRALTKVGPCLCGMAFCAK